MPILPEEVKKKNNPKQTNKKKQHPTTSTYLRYFICSKNLTRARRMERTSPGQEGGSWDLTSRRGRTCAGRQDERGHSEATPAGAELAEPPGLVSNGAEDQTQEKTSSGEMSAG